MRPIARGSLLGKYFSELHQQQRILDFACGKGGTSKELLSRKITVQKVKDSRERAKYNVQQPVYKSN